MLRSSSNVWRRFHLDRVAKFRPDSSHPLSSTATSRKSDAAAANGESEDGKKEHPQPFVQVNLSPGEWDINRSDPFFRPKPDHRSNLISAEDFANRPPVGFDGEFGSYQDAMISLSWMDQKTSKAIYDTYVNMMVMTQQKFQTTSHEYVVRVIAEKYQITTTRAAGIIQLQHAEVQMQQNHPELLCPDQANHAEETILQNIRDAYKSENLQAPGGGRGGRMPFVEDPVGIHGRGEPDETSRRWAKADDIYDMEQKLVRANQKDAERARILIDNHVYKEDDDERQQLVKTDASSQRLLKAQEALKSKSTELNSNPITNIPYPETNGKGEKRDRWKYVAQVVNTRKLKKKQHEQGRRRGGTTSYTNNHLGNTLVEQNGKLRIATVAEAKETAWKPTRTRSNEYLYEGVKTAWLEKTLHDKTNVWGRPAFTRASDAIDKADAAASKADKATKEAPEDAKDKTEVDEVEVAASNKADTSTEEEETNIAEVDKDAAKEAASPAVDPPSKEDAAPATNAQEESSEEKPKS